MPDFTVTDEIVSQIAVQYNTTEKEVETIRRFYKKFANDMKRQYLAHVIRTMEERLRQISGNEMFRIVCSPVDETSKILGIAGAQYFKNRYFAIYYHPKTEEKQLRVLLAHELGHLFLIELVNSKFDQRYDEKTKIEPLATIFGIFTIFDKNEFYHNKTAPFKHKSPEEILSDFSLLRNRDNDILNIS
jgi:Zn-dependent peptidase ImmA (M78 family)